MEVSKSLYMPPEPVQPRPGMGEGEDDLMNMFVNPSLFAYPPETEEVLEQAYCEQLGHLGSGYNSGNMNMMNNMNMNLYSPYNRLDPIQEEEDESVEKNKDQKTGESTSSNPAFQNNMTNFFHQNKPKNNNYFQNDEWEDDRPRNRTQKKYPKSHKNEEEAKLFLKNLEKKQKLLKAEKLFNDLNLSNSFSTRRERDEYQSDKLFQLKQYNNVIEDERKKDKDELLGDLMALKKQHNIDAEEIKRLKVQIQKLKQGMRKDKISKTQSNSSFLRDTNVEKEKEDLIIDLKKQLNDKDYENKVASTKLKRMEKTKGKKIKNSKKLCTTEIGTNIDYNKVLTLRLVLESKNGNFRNEVKRQKERIQELQSKVDVQNDEIFQLKQRGGINVVNSLKTQLDKAFQVIEKFKDDLHIKTTVDTLLQKEKMKSPNKIAFEEKLKKIDIEYKKQILVNQTMNITGGPEQSENLRNLLDNEIESYSKQGNNLQKDLKLHSSSNELENTYKLKSDSNSNSEALIVNDFDNLEDPVLEENKENIKIEDESKNGKLENQNHDANTWLNVKATIEAWNKNPSIVKKEIERQHQIIRELQEKVSFLESKLYDQYKANTEYNELKKVPEKSAKKIGNKKLNKDQAEKMRNLENKLNEKKFEISRLKLILKASQKK